MEDKLYQLETIMDYMAPTVITSIGPIEITSTVVMTWIVMIILFIFAWIMGRNIAVRPTGKKQHIIEMALGFVIQQLEEILGKDGRKYLPLVGTLFLFIIFLNMSWFIPNMQPPTTDFSTTFAFGITTVLIIQVISIGKNGVLGYVKHWAEPVPMLLPLNIIEEIIKPVTLGLRLYANMFGEKMAVTIIFILIPVIVPTPIMMLGIIMGLIQALVFTLLPITYLATHLHGH